MQGVTIQTSTGSVSTPDFSNMGMVNEDGYKCDKCPEGSNEANCWNVDVATYATSWASWKESSWPTIQAVFEKRLSEFNYGQVETDSLRLAEWAENVQENMNTHKSWLNDMDNNVNLKKRCCVTRSPFGRNIERLREANDAMRNDLATWKNEVISYAQSTGETADELEAQGINAEQYQNELQENIANVTEVFQDDKRKTQLLFGGIGVALLLVIVYFARR